MEAMISSRLEKSRTLLLVLEAINTDTYVLVG